MKIWIPEGKILEPPEPIGFRFGLAGLFKMEAVRPDGRRRLLADWFPNLITNAGLNGVGTTATWINQCRVGTGTATPDVNDTALQNQLAVTTTTQSDNGTAESTAPYFGARTVVKRFAIGAAAGNLTEVGMGMSSSPNTLFSRELIRDSVGDPTTVTVLSDELLDVTYQLRLYPPLIDVEDEIELDGNAYDYVLRASEVTTASRWAFGTSGVLGQWSITIGQNQAFDGAVGVITGAPSGTSAPPASISNATYSNNSLERDCTVTWGLLQGNLTGGIDATVGAFGGGAGNSHGFGKLQIGFTPAIPKTSSQILTLNYRASWSRRIL